MMKTTEKNKALIIDILCKSFEENKSVNYVIKQDAKRRERIKTLMEYSFDLCSLFGNVYLSADKKACALTLLPDQKKTNLKTILLDAKLALSAIGLSRVSKVLGRESKIKQCYPNNHILYLWFIGVNPEEQRRGIGSVLLQEIIRDSNTLKRPIYLETSMIENVRFYQKHGFEVYKELDFGHKLYLIRRESN